MSKRNAMTCKGFCASCRRWRELLHCVTHDLYECKRCVLSKRHKYKVAIPAGLVVPRSTALALADWMPV